MKIFGLTMLVDVVLSNFVKNLELNATIRMVLYIVALVCWGVGTYSLNRDWKKEKISHNIFLILSYSALFYVASRTI